MRSQQEQDLNQREEDYEEQKEDSRAYKENVQNKSFKDDQTEKSYYNKKPKNAEESVVPALNLKLPIDFNTIGEEAFDGGEKIKAEEEDLKLNNIPTLLRPIADAILPHVGEEVTCKIFAKSWQLREQGIQ